MLFAFAGVPQVNRTLFNDFEGSRGEFLKILLEQGEVPAFIRRAQSVTESWIQICDHCRSQRKLMLRWPWMHLSILANRLRCDWSLLARYLVDERQATYIEALYVDWKGSLEGEPSRRIRGQVFETFWRVRRVGESLQLQVERVFAACESGRGQSITARLQQILLPGKGLRFRQRRYGEARIQATRPCHVRATLH